MVGVGFGGGLGGRVGAGMGFRSRERTELHKIPSDRIVIINRSSNQMRTRAAH